jgi:hypothetical protein
VWVFLIAPPLGAALAAAVHRAVVSGTIGPAAPAVAEVLEEG